MEQWRPPTEYPGDGESIWIHVLEHDGANTHTDYAQTFIDVDGLLIHRYEGERGEYGEPWPDGLLCTKCNRFKIDPRKSE